MIMKRRNCRDPGSHGDRTGVMAVASLVIITLVTAVRAGGEHLLAGGRSACAAMGGR